MKDESSPVPNNNINSQSTDKAMVSLASMPLPAEHV